MARGSRGFQPSSRDRFQPMVVETDSFPDEVMVDLDDKDPQNYVDVTEIDDTPEADRGKPTEVGDTVLDEEELRGISKRTQNRIARLRFETETERRGREAAERQLSIAVEEARIAREEAARLKAIDGPRTAALGSAMLARVDEGLASARAQLAKAIEDGDAKGQADATAKLSGLSAERVNIQARIPRAPAAGEKPAEEQQRQQPSQQQQQPIAPEVLSWLGRHEKWFNKDIERTNTAMGINEGLLRSGVTNHTERLKEVDKRLKAIYPDHMSSDDEDQGRNERQRGSRRPNAVADSSRDSDNRPGNTARQVTLTSSQLAIAKKLGVSPQDYARQVLLRDQREGNGAR